MSKARIKKIKPGEPFQMDDGIFVYSVGENGILVLNKIKAVAAIKPAFIAPTLEQAKAYAKEEGFTEEIGEKAWTNYEMAEPKWTNRDGKPIRNWKQTFKMVWFRPEHKIVTQKNTSGGGMVM